MPDPVRYNDLLARLILSLIAAHILVSLGETESFFQLLVLWDYWRSLLISFLIAFALISIVYACTVTLDQKFDWIAKPLARAIMQLLCAITIPAVIAFLLADIYFRAYGISIFRTIYLKFDYPVIVLMLLLLNVYYVAFYFFRRWQQSKPPVIDGNNSHTDKKEHIFLVTRGTQNIPIQVPDIAYWYHDGDYNFLRTFDGEDFVISETLDSIEKRLDSHRFFRANRQVIINIEACVNFELLEYGKLKVIAIPTFKKDIVISQKRARDFKAWIKRRSYATDMVL